MYRIGLLLLLHFEVTSQTFFSTYDCTQESYQTDWLLISGAPGYITSTLLNGMSFVNGWEQNFFVSKWSMHQLVNDDQLTIISFDYISSDTSFLLVSAY